MRTRRQRVLCLFVLPFVIGAFPGTAVACTRGEFGIPECAYFTRATAVFIGRIVRIEKDFPENKNGFWKRIHFQVVKSFKGPTSKTISVLTPPWEAACGIKAKQGQKWLVYGNDNGEQSLTVDKADTRLLSEVDKSELEFLANASKGASQTSIYGRIVPFGGNPTYFFSGVKVTIENHGTIDTTNTDKDGKYSFASVAPGDYKVRLNFDYLASFYWIYRDVQIAWMQRDPTIAQYEIRLNGGECDYRYMEASRPNR
jgi:hypothetical protein